jgi:hypothetical protein
MRLDDHPSRRRSPPRRYVVPHCRRPKRHVPIFKENKELAYYLALESESGTWLAEAYFTENISPLGYLYQIDVAKDNMGYLLDQYSRDLLMLLALGTIYRVAFGVRFMYRAKQR